MGIAVSGNIPKNGVSDAEALDDRETVEMLLSLGARVREALFFFQRAPPTGPQHACRGVRLLENGEPECRRSPTCTPWASCGVQAVAHLHSLRHQAVAALKASAQDKHEEHEGDLVD